MLFCRRCHRYDCFLHKDKQATPNLNIEPKMNSSNYRPCSPQCYRIASKEKKIELRRSYSEIADHRSSRPSTNGYLTRRPKFTTMKSDPLSSSNGLSIKSSFKRSLTNDVGQWSANEKSLFRVFHSIYGDNICLIADLLDKPCSQVYSLYMKEIEDHEQKPTLQRQNSEASTSTIGSFSGITSTASSDSIGIKSNEIGEKAMTSNGDEPMIVCNGKHEQHSVGLTRILSFEKIICIDILRSILVHRPLVDLIHPRFVVNNFYSIIIIRIIPRPRKNVIIIIHVIMILRSPVTKIVIVFVRAISARNSVVVQARNVIIVFLAVVVDPHVQRNNVPVMQLDENVIRIYVHPVVPMIFVLSTMK